MVVDDSAGLHRCVDGRRPDEAEARLAQLLRERHRAGRLRGASRRGTRAAGRRPGTTRRAPAARARNRATRLSRARWRSRPRSCRGDGRSRRREQPLDVPLPELGDADRGRSPRTPRGTPRACAGSSATRARTGSPPGRAARRARARRRPAGPTPRRGSALYCGVGVSQQRSAHLAISPSPCRPRPRRERSRRHERRQGERAPVRRSMLEPCRGQITRHALLARIHPRRAGRRRASSGLRARAAHHCSCRRRPRSSRVTSLTEPGPNSASGATGSFTFLPEGQIVRQALPLLGQRRALGLVEGDLQHPETEDRALEADRRQRDPDLLEQLFLRQRRRSPSRVRPVTISVSIEVAACADRAAAAGELDLVDRLAVLRRTRRRSTPRRRRAGSSPSACASASSIAPCPRGFL